MHDPRQDGEFRENNGANAGGDGLPDAVPDEFVERHDDQQLLQEWPNQQEHQHQHQHQQQPQPQPQPQMVLSPSDVDNILSQELMELSVRTRNNIQEEIHGVRCQAPIETSEFVASSLRKLEAEFDRVHPSEKNNSFLIARRLRDESYANTLEFKLRFLRKCLFNAKEATACIIEYFYRMHTTFGDFALRRPLNFHKDFDRAEIREFRKGRLQLLPFRDRSGRRVLVIFPDEEYESMGPELRGKFIAYMLGVAAQGDKETQQKGLVIIVWFAPSYNISYHTPMREGALRNYGQWGCVRLVGVHICSPNTPGFLLRRSITALKAHSFRSRVKMHAGTQVELRYILLGYGIPTENIPMTWSGTVKTVYFKNWLKLRKGMEDSVAVQRWDRLRMGTNYVPSNNIMSVMSQVVECPNTNDVIFRQGTAMYCHPGNSNFRSLVEETVIELKEQMAIKLREHENTNTSCEFGETSEIVNNVPDTVDASEEGSPSVQLVSTSSLIFELIDKIIEKDGGRILIWTPILNPEKYRFGCWCIITDEDQMYSKIEYIVRENMRGRQGQLGVRQQQQQQPE